MNYYLQLSHPCYIAFEPTDSPHSYLMLTLLGIITLLSVAGVFAASIVEASFNAISLAHARHQAEEGGSKLALILVRLKEHPARAIGAILILRALPTVIGALAVGAIASREWGREGVLACGVAFLVVVLYAGEIFPKVLGALYARSLAPLAALPLSWAVSLFAPFISVGEWIARKIERGRGEPSMSPEDLLTMAELGLEEGALDNFEGAVIANVIGLDQLHVRDMQTPRVSLFCADETTTLDSVTSLIPEWSFSRIPIFREDDPEHLTGYVIQRDVMRAILRGERDRTLGDFRRPLKVVPEVMRVDKLLKEFFAERVHIAAVVDEHGGLAGIITLEDILEEVVGHEIIDEYDLYGLQSGEDARHADKVLQFTRNREKKLRALEKRREQRGTTTPPGVG